MISKSIRNTALPIIAIFALAACSSSASGSGSGSGTGASPVGRPDGVPAKGASPIVDSILARGTLRVGVFLEFPWLTKSQPGASDPYEGSAWFLATKVADALHVKIEPVQVSNDTKVATVQSRQVDLAIAPLTVTPARQKVISFIVYSKGTVCFFGLKSNPNLNGITTVDDLKSSKGLTHAYFVGQPNDIITKLFPNLTMKGVSGSGNAPVPELIAGRADLVSAICAKSAILKKANSDLYSIPEDPTTSDLNPNPIGMGIAKDDPKWEAFVNSVKDNNLAAAQKIERDRVLGSESK